MALNICEGAFMFVSGYVKNVEEGVSFCERYGISCSVVDGELMVLKPPFSYYEQYKAMEKAARNLEGFGTDHPNSYISDSGNLIVTFSDYNAVLTEEGRKKMRRKGYDLRESGFDLYGSGTTTYVMAELVSPLDEGGLESSEV